MLGCSATTTTRPGQQGSEEINYTWAEQSCGRGCGVEQSGAGCIVYRGRDAGRDGGVEEEMDSAVSVAAVVARREVVPGPGAAAATAAAAEEVTQFCRNVRIPGMWRPRPGPHSAAAVE